VLTKDQREARKRYIGSSDSPAIVGLDPYRGPQDVYLTKIAEVSEIEDKEAVEIGNDFEKPLVQWAGRQLGIKLKMSQMAIHPGGILASNIDGIGTGKSKRVGIEAKTGSGEGYGEEETDQVPERVLVQALHHAEVWELDVVWIPVLVARFDHLHRGMYRVQRNERAQSLIVDHDTAFWRNHVVPRLPPAGQPASLELLKRIRRRPETLAILKPEIVTSWEKLREERLKAEKDESKALAEMLTAMGDAEGADWGDPDRIVTFLEQSRRGYVVPETNYRVARLTKRSR